MENILGIDLGTNSIGWAIRDYTKNGNQIIDKGVLTFEKGVAEGKSGEFPKVQKRTESRHKRRNYQAEKYRKHELLKALIENNMCPLTIEELDEWKKYRKGIGRKYPQSEKFITWLRYDFNNDGRPDYEAMGFDKHENPYLFRALAVSEDMEIRSLFHEHPHLLGRILYHLVQRRGFRGRDDEEAQTMLVGSDKNDIKGRNELAHLIEKHKTLGAALYYNQKERPAERIRKRYNLRTDVDAELKEICRVNNIKEDTALYKSIFKAIIWQRPLRSQKGNIGICTFEKDKARCPVSHPLYEEFRTWVFLNNLRIQLPDDVNRLDYINENIYPAFYRHDKQFEVEKITKILQKSGGIIKAKFKDYDKAPSASFLKTLETVLGEDWKNKYGWEEMLNNKSKTVPYSIDDIWHVLYTFDSKEKLKEFASEKLRLSEEQAEKFSKVKLQSGYATLSLAAIKKLLPSLKKGVLYSDAVYLANLPKILDRPINDDLIQSIIHDISEVMKFHKNFKEQAGIVNALISDHLNAEHRFGFEKNYTLDNDDKNDIEIKILETLGDKTWNEKHSEDDRNKLRSFVAHHYQEFLRKPINERKDNLFISIPRKHDAIKNLLIEKYGVSVEKAKYLWHPSEQENYSASDNGLLHDPQPISRGFKNPMALKTLHYLKKLINCLIQSGKIDAQTRIVIEIARELNDSNKRAAIEKWQRDREKENAGYTEKIREVAEQYPHLNLNPGNTDLVDKYRLWEEQGRMCLYTGNIINCYDLFDGNKYNLEHTVPASQSFDNELKNLTIADITYNQQIKANQLPAMLPNYDKDAMIAGKLYTAIKPRIKFIEEKVSHFSDLVNEWRQKSRYASTKEIKDAVIQKKHIYQMELDYWYKKLDTFTITEYKAAWRNSQLRDTQTITKYALPYLKTAFEKVEVQKGTVTDAFRKIYRIQPREEKKDRNVHSHHAVDAAVLTLIPSAVNRDKDLKNFFEAEENYKAYHIDPPLWKNFDSSFIREIRETTLINYQNEDRILTPAIKHKRTRGRVQYVKEKLPDGEWIYKKDASGNKIPLIASGDSIRGQLHKESFFGAIKQDGEILLVERYPISVFTAISDCKNIIDPAVRKIVQEELERRTSTGISFKDAVIEPIAFGKTVIKKARCKVAAGRGYLTKEKALEIRKHDFQSKHEHKQYLYAQNDENVLCLFYSNLIIGPDRVNTFKLINLMELANLRLQKIDDLKKIDTYNKVSASKKRSKELQEIALIYIIKRGHKVIFYNESPTELKELSNDELIKRLYIVRKFNEMGTPQIYLDYHLEARKDGVTEFTKVDFNTYQGKLKIKASEFNCAIEDHDFNIMIDGTIKWNPRFFE